VLKLAGARLLDDRDVADVGTALAADPVTSCMVAARVETTGLDPWRLGGELWGFGDPLEGLCFSGPNLVPLRGGRSAIRAFADRAAGRARSCSSMVGPAEQVLELWSQLRGPWGPAREERPSQPLMMLADSPRVAADPMVRPVRPDELDRYLPAAIAMFTEEVGVDPRLPDGGAGYRARVAELIAAGRAFARFEGAEVVFKAEIGAMSSTVGQIQGVWVHPDRRGQGLASAGSSAVVERLHRMSRIASLYVNAFNLPARAAYRRIGFTQIGSFATVLF
jgi:predicted GNAT family acetyltransferase